MFAPPFFILSLRKEEEMRIKMKIWEVKMGGLVFDRSSISESGTSWYGHQNLAHQAITCRSDFILGDLGCAGVSHCNKKTRKRMEKIYHIFITSQNIVLKSFLQHDSLCQGFVLQTERIALMSLVPFHICHRS